MRRWVVLSLLGSGLALAQGSGPLVSARVVGAPSEADRQTWCGWLLEGLRSAVGSAPATCDGGPADAAFQARLERRPLGELHLVLDRPLLARAPSQVRSLRWTVEPGAESRRKEAVRAALADWRSLEDSDRSFRELVLLRAARSAATVALASDGAYLDAATGRRLGFDEAFQLYLEREAHPADFVGATLELAALLGAGSGWYEMATTVNSADWEYDFSWTTLHKKLVTGEAVGFDTNPLYLNTPGHALAGSCYVLSARANGLSIPESLVAAAVASTAWELVAEFREQVSINDLVITPVGGLAFGEPLHQLSVFFRQSEPTAVNRVLAELFGGPSSLASARRRSVPAGVRLLDGRGHPASTRAFVAAAVGADVLRLSEDGRRRAGGRVGFQSVLLPDALPPLGRGLVGRTGTLFTRLDAAGTFDLQGLRDLSLLGEVGYLGVMGQDLTLGRNGEAGAEAMLAASALYEHEERVLAGRAQQLGAVALLGATARAEAVAGGLRLRTTGSAHPVFAAVHSLAADPARTGAAAGEDLPEVLVKSGYYYATGWRTSLSVELRYRRAAAGFETTRYLLAPVVLPDDALSEATSSLADQRRAGAVWLALELPLPDTRVVVRAQRASAWSRGPDAALVEAESRVLLSLEVLL